MIRQRESKLAGLMLLLTLLFGALFVTPISRAETYEWLYLSLHQNVALPNTNVQLSVYGYLEEPARLSVFYIPVEDLDTASRLAERIPALDAVAPLESRTIALNGGKADYVSRTYSFRLGSPGYYVFVAQLADGTFEQREAVLVTELSLVVKHGPSTVLVSAHDLRSGEALEGIEILVESSGREVARGITDDRGIAVWQSNDLPFHLTITGFGKPGAARVFTSTYAEPLGYRAYLYTDRPVYRPGQTVHFKGVVRMQTEDGYSVPADEPVLIQIRDADYQLIYQAERRTNEWGSFHGEFRLASEPTLGLYELSARIGEVTEWSTFRVAAYQKAEYAVSMQPLSDTYVVGDEIEVELNAAFYYGEPLRHAAVEYTVYSQPLWSDGYGGYGDLITWGSGLTDENGRMHLTIPTRPSSENEWYVIEAIVYDPGGRGIEAVQRIAVHRGTFDIAIEQDQYIANVGDTTTFTVRTQRIDGTPIEQALQFEVLREEWDGAYYNMVPIDAGEITTDAEGRGRYAFTSDASGYYLIRFSGQDERGNTVTASGYIYVGEYGFAGPRDGIDMVTDQDAYMPGDTARIMLSSALPPGPVLVSVEGSQLYDWYIVEIGEQAVSLDIPIRAAYAPNVWISAVAVRGQQFYQTNQRIEVINEAHRLQLEVTADREQYEPGDIAVYSVVVRDAAGQPVQAEVSFSLVDEAIYAIQDEFVRPIDTFFYREQRWDVYTNYSFPWGYLAGPAKGAPPDLDIRDEFQDTAYWQAVILTDESGQAVIEVPLPDNLTTWRATVRGHTLQTEVGEARHHIQVNKPLLVRLAAPRFFSQGDEAEIAVFIHNDSGEPRELRAGLEVHGLTVLSGEEQTLTIPDGGREVLTYRVRADRSGTARLIPWAQDIAADEHGVRLSDAAESLHPVHPRGEPYVERQHGRLVGTASGTPEEQTFTLQLPDGLPLDEAALQLQLHFSLIGPLFEAAAYLATYPWGCVEQTMSSFLPNVILTQVIEAGGLSRPELLAELDDMVMAGLQRLYRMQHNDGGWGWWENDATDPYMTAYVVYGLVEARDAGYVVDEYVLQRGIDVLGRLMAEETNIDRLGFMAYALTRAGAADRMRPTLDELWERREAMSAYVRSLLVQSLARTGELEQAEIGLAELAAAKGMVGTDRAAWPISLWESDAQERDFWVRSGIETAAHTLAAYVLVDPDHPHVHLLAQGLTNVRRGQAWLSTKDTAASLMALARYVQHHPDELLPATGITALYVNGALAAEYAAQADAGYSPGDTLTVSTGLRSGANEFALQREGMGPVYFTAALTGYRPVDRVLAAAEGVSVSRQYMRLAHREQGGRQLAYTTTPLLGPVKVGERIRVRLTIEVPEDVDYIMIQDPIPAGFSVLEPSLNGGWRISRAEVRDDRVAFFATVLPAGEVHVVEYDLRAERPGVYWARPTDVASMYDPDTWGRSTEARLEIVPGAVMQP